MNSVVFDRFFFFVKQKTAYEMRISDWSSDVCSSDLIRMQPGDLLYIPRGRYHDALASENGALHIAFGVTLPKIGRASCRERVCQYGVDLGGRRIIKKTTVLPTLINHDTYETYQHTTHIKQTCH